MSVCVCVCARMHICDVCVCHYFTLLMNMANFEASTYWVTYCSHSPTNFTESLDTSNTNIHNCICVCAWCVHAYVHAFVYIIQIIITTSPGRCCYKSLPMFISLSASVLPAVGNSLLLMLM